MVMCSDFSLKALINQWSERRFGPNPFVQVGEFDGQMRLHFDPQTLMACQSTQLKMLGEMCGSDGTATLHAMPMTIAFSVDSCKSDTSAYSLQVLTVATGMTGVNMETLPQHLVCEADGHRGACGQAILKYPSGGALLVSAGHWIDLTDVSVSEDKLLQVVAATYGDSRSIEIGRQIFASAPGSAARRNAVQSISSTMIQSSPPCSRTAPAALPRKPASL
jgi:hypothetical protein